MRFDDPRKDGFGCADIGVLTDRNCSAKRWLVSLVSAGFHAFGTERASAVIVLQLVPVETFGVGFVRFIPIALDQHHRHIGNLPHRSLTPGAGRFRRIKTLMLAAEQLPQKSQ
ncbi:hypothetical protein D3C78_1709470 [compost metagenome]